MCVYFYLLEMLIKIPNCFCFQAQVLVLSNNNFVSFPSQLAKFTKVVSLNLASNHINHPLPSYFRNWHVLSRLNLSNNNYETWSSSGYQLNMNILDLSKNKINSIDQDAFRYTPLLQHLDLSENRIYDLPSTVFAEAKNLDTLILSRNYLSEVPSFQSHSMKHLLLSNCQIMEVNVNSLVGMNSLLHIDLSMNQLEELPDNLASHTLQEFDLGYNEISNINDWTFSSLPHLAVLDLRGNEFKEVWSTSHFSSNPFLREVYVKGNRWSCEGFSVNLLLTYEFLTKDPPKVIDTASLICYSPSNVTQLSWQQAYIKTWHPNDATTESYTTVAVLIGVIIGIVITSMVCRGLMSINKPDPPRPPVTNTANLNGITQPRVESVIMRVPLSEEDLPPSYDEALLMPRLNSSFHSLPDFIEDEEPPSRRYRRSRSIGDLTEYRPRTADRRSTRRTVDIRIN